MISFSDAILPPNCRTSVDPCRVPVRCWWFEWASKVESLCSSFFHELHREWSPSNASVRDHSATEEFSYKKNYLTYIHLRWKKKESTKFTLISRSRIPAVINLIAEFSPIFLSCQTCKNNYSTETNTNLMRHPLGSGEDSHTTCLCNTDNPTSRTESLWTKTSFIK